MWKSLQPLPFTRQELKALLMLGATGLLMVTAVVVARLAPALDVAREKPPALVNLNTASAEALEALPGIGPVTARRIVEDRRLHGRFLRVEELARVKGLSTKSIPRLKAQATIE